MKKIGLISVWVLPCLFCSSNVINVANAKDLSTIICIQTDCDNPTNGSRTVTKLFDGNTGSKWFADKGFVNTFPYIAWEYANPWKVKLYSLTSGNDMPIRDPKSWNLYGSNDVKNYVLIDKQENVVFEGRIETKDFKLLKPANYKYFKLEIIGVAAENMNAPP